jgi:hypothetical protein
MGVTATLYVLDTGNSPCVADRKARSMRRVGTGCTASGWQEGKRVLFVSVTSVPYHNFRHFLVYCQLSIVNLCIFCSTVLNFYYPTSLFSPALKIRKVNIVPFLDFNFQHTEVIQFMHCLFWALTLTCKTLTPASPLSFSCPMMYHSVAVAQIFIFPCCRLRTSLSLDCGLCVIIIIVSLMTCMVHSHLPLEALRYLSLTRCYMSMILLLCRWLVL